MNTKYEGSLEEFISHEIYLNVNHLAHGNYKLKILNRDKVIKTIYFKKNN